MAEADYSMTEMAFSNPQDNVNPADYAGLLVRFVLHPHQNKEKSKAAGRPIYEEREYVDVRKPGDRTWHQFRPVASIDIARWPKHYEAFKSRAAEPSEGTPLEQWPAINRSLVEELKFFHVNTVEQLAALDDLACQKFMGIRTWKDKAVAFLAASGESAAAEAMANALSERDAQIADLTARMDAMAARLAEDAEED